MERSIPSRKDVERAHAFSNEWDARNENGTCTTAWIASQGEGIDSLVTVYRYIRTLAIVED
jgi:hypothetical protein